MAVVIRNDVHLSQKSLGHYPASIPLQTYVQLDEQ